MQNLSDGLQAYGFDGWFRDGVDSGILPGSTIARVIAVHKESCMITNGEIEVLAELIGKLVFTATSPKDFPAVGDWVLAHLYDGNTFAVIHQILARRTLLTRKTPGKKIDFQLIAANIDVAFVVQSLDDNFNLRRLERYLVLINESHIRPVVLLSKSDLLTSDEIENRMGEIAAIMPDLTVRAFSNKEASNLKKVTDLLEPGLTYCLVGSSGVGKTTLLNNLMGASVLKTKSVRQKDSKGRHATTQRQLIKLTSGALLIDTPGMRELGTIAVETGLDETFDDIIRLSEACRFNDCTHVEEKGCAVLEAVTDGRLSSSRYRNYIKMKKESDYHDMSYLEKRDKDREFGKLIKRVMKQKKFRR